MIRNAPQQTREPNGGKRRPGRPRSENSRQAILRSTIKLLRLHGFADLSIEAIAANAKVGKATVYRWWPNKGALVVDAFASSTADELHFPDSGSVYKDMSLQMTQWLAVLRSSRGCIVRAIIGAGQSDPDLLEEFRKRLLRPRRQEAYQTLRRGIERGELPKDLDLDLVLDTLYGAIYMRFLIRHDELTEQYVTDMCRMVLEGASQARPRSGASNGKNGSHPRSRRRSAHTKSARA
jgi:AcrR family transcriptional regulator